MAIPPDRGMDNFGSSGNKYNNLSCTDNINIEGSIERNERNKQNNRPKANQKRNIKGYDNFKL